SPFPLKVNGQSLPPGTTCKSSDISILSVGAKCMLTPKKAGGPVTLTVNIPHKAPSIITGVKVEKAVGTAANGHPLKAHTAITDVVGKTGLSAAATGGNGHLHYAVSPTTVATIDNKGVLKLLKPGLATVTVTDDGDVNHKKQSQTTSVTVLGKAQTFNAPQLTFGTSPFPLKVNGQSLPPGTTCKSSDISILSVGAKCMLTPKKAGGPVTLTVNIPHKAPSIITGVKVEKALGTAANGHPLKAHAAITDVVGKTSVNAAATGGNGHLHYAVSPTTVARIDNKGVLKLLKPGLATVTVTDDGDVNHKKQSQTTSVTVLGKAQTFNAPQLTFGTSPFPLKVNGQSLPPGTTCKSSDERRVRVRTF
ncbi:hypothetical protein, partial [Vibrio mediterranei]|uniref:hypothetical protein n=1 Tax=Vibrio mediterranei TaxID=689 RepID=UPI001EFEB398